MSKMQAFHAWLFQDQDGSARDAHTLRLTQLTQVSPAQMKAFESDMSWETWGAAEPAATAATRSA